MLSYSFDQTSIPSEQSNKRVFEMFGIKKLFDPAARLACHVEKAKEAQEKGSWKAASYHWARASDMTRGAGSFPYYDYAVSRHLCDKEIDAAKARENRSQNLLNRHGLGVGLRHDRGIDWPRRYPVGKGLRGVQAFENLLTPQIAKAGRRVGDGKASAKTAFPQNRVNDNPA
jgi:hypothetical protein